MKAALVMIWKICQSGPRCCFIWNLQVTYNRVFPAKLVCISMIKIYRDMQGKLQHNVKYTCTLRVFLLPASTTSASLMRARPGTSNACQENAHRHIKLAISGRGLNNGNRTEWSPIWSVIIGVINKIGRPRSGSPIC